MQGLKRVKKILFAFVAFVYRHIFIYELDFSYKVK